MKNSKLLLFFIILIGLVWNLSNIPPLWWDEGWTISLARNWVEFGIYGQINNGVAQSPGLSAAFPVVVPIALSFKLFGIGVWQGRLPFVLFSLGAFLFLYYLGKNLYSPKIAFGAIILSIFTPLAIDVNPLIMGKQILGEMPSIFFLLAGLSLLYKSKQKNVFYITLTILMWGIAIRTKAQIFPVLIAALCLPIGILFLKRERRQAIVLVSILICSYFSVKYIIAPIQLLFVGDQMVSYQKIEGIISVMGFVINKQTRISAILMGFSLGIPTLSGLVYYLINWIKSSRFNSGDMNKEIIRLILFGFVSVWFGWFFIFAMDLQRYIFPSIYLGNIFVADFLFNITDGYKFKRTFNSALVVFLPWCYKKYERSEIRRVTYSLIVVIWFCISMAITICLLYYPFFDWIKVSPESVAKYINSLVSTDSVIETYDPELFVFLNNKYHYPPDQLHVELIRRQSIDPTWNINYDPLEANPDYLIVGPFSRMWKLYEPVIALGEFTLITSFPRYDIYIRNRP